MAHRWSLVRLRRCALAVSLVAWVPSMVLAIGGASCAGDESSSAGEPCPIEGASEACYPGPPATRGVGACRDGARTCAGGRWSSCAGAVVPMPDGCDDATDNDCNGVADEGCPCELGSSRACYGGPAATRGVGSCRAGVQQCVESLWAAECTGQVLPAPEICDGADQNCNGIADDECVGAGGGGVGGSGGVGNAGGFGATGAAGGEGGEGAAAPCLDPGTDAIETNDYTGIGVNDSLEETIYNPFVLWDAQESRYKMWYAGWQSQTQDFPHDKIYYRTSADGVTGWSGYQTVWTPGPPHMPTAGYHVNSPAVMKAWNPETQAYQYTMFFEFAESGTPLAQQESLWSVVSADGVNWVDPRPLRDAGDDACDATMVPSYDGYNIYQILFTGSGGPAACGDRLHVWRVKSDGYRNPNPADAEAIYERTAEVVALNGILANPHAARVNGRWQLWFNVYHGPPGNHYTSLAKAPCCTEGPGGELGVCSGFEWVLPAPLTGQPGEPCTTATPGVLELPGDSQRYRLYQSLGYRSDDSVCRWYPQFMIHMLVRE